MKYICIFRLLLTCFLVARKENLTGFLTGLTGRWKNLDPIGAGRPDRFQSLSYVFVIHVFAWPTKRRWPHMSPNSKKFEG